jgi:hypothetical protein
MVSSIELPTAHLDYLAGITTVAPFVALLGAKRPQDRAWQWIVAALVGLLIFQDLRSWSIDPTASPALHPAWRWLLGGLVIVQWINYLPTRQAAAACLASLAQACILAGNLPFLSERSSWTFPVGFALLSLAVLVAAVSQRRQCRSADPFQDAWLDFRDAYGTLWALRIVERVNSLTLGQAYDLPLTWHGFVPVESAETASENVPPSGKVAPVHRALRSVLSRFVSTNWLSERGVSEDT